MADYTGKRGELDFEKDLVDLLSQQGWKDGVLDHLPVHSDTDYVPGEIHSLEDNFRVILNKNNRQALNSVDLSDQEFGQVMALVYAADTPVKANMLINGCYVSVRRDPDSDDKEHAGMPVHLDIFSRQAIGTGDSVYQVAKEVVFDYADYKSRRGDVTLLINGLPVIHIELKTDKAGIDQALGQIEKYLGEGVFTGLMGLVQVFFAMTPSDAVYFANYGAGNRNDDFVFRWAGKPRPGEGRALIKDWRVLCGAGDRSLGSAMLSIPEAHQLVGVYTVAEVYCNDTDKQTKGPENISKGVLKVMRYYQYHAVRAILDRVMERDNTGWDVVDPLGGICWCTTGGGKTLSSFKAGEAIIDQNLADKVVFVVDRKELDNQAVDDYNAFSREGHGVKQVTNSHELYDALKSENKHAMIITSIQKLNRVANEDRRKWAADLAKIQAMKIVFIVDEAQRSQFGNMHKEIKAIFPKALYFGFTGTPIMAETEESDRSTDKVFGDYISIYTIADGIRDGNVLGFAPKQLKTYRDHELRKVVALSESGARDEAEALADEKKAKIYKKYMGSSVAMPSEYIDSAGNACKGIEAKIPAGYYDNPEHRDAVLAHIRDEWNVVSVGGKGTRMSAMLSTASVKEVIEYYKLFETARAAGWDIKTAALFSTGDSNQSGQAGREAEIDRIITNYENMFGVRFQGMLSDRVQAYKKDVMDRLAHKKAYKNIGNDSDKILDIVIVDDQLLVGYDSKYLSTLYLDRVLESSKLIQAISRTNRVLDKDDKEFGQVRFFRKCYTMADNLNEALRTYCEGDNACVIVDDVAECVRKANRCFEDIVHIFEKDGVKNFVRLPRDPADRGEFKKLFRDLKSRIEAIRLQGGLVVTKGFDGVQWDVSTLSADSPAKGLIFTCDGYNILLMRYMDMLERNVGTGSDPKMLFRADTNLSEVEMDKIDADYLEKHFRIAVPVLADANVVQDEKIRLVQDLKDNFGRLSALQQVHAEAVLAGIEDGSIAVIQDKTFREYIQEHMTRAKRDAVSDMAGRYGVDPNMLYKLCERMPDEASLDLNLEFSRVTDMIDVGKAAAYHNLSGFKAKRTAYEELKDFVLELYRKI